MSNLVPYKPINPKTVGLTNGKLFAYVKDISYNFEELQFEKVFVVIELGYGVLSSEERIGPFIKKATPIKGKGEKHTIITEREIEYY